MLGMLSGSEGHGRGQGAGDEDSHAPGRQLALPDAIERGVARQSARVDRVTQRRRRIGASVSLVPFLALALAAGALFQAMVLMAAFIWIWL